MVREMIEEVIICGSRYRPGLNQHSNKLFLFNGIEWIKSSRSIKEYERAIKRKERTSIDEYRPHMLHSCNDCGRQAVRGYKNGRPVFQPGLCKECAPNIKENNTGLAL